MIVSVYVEICQESTSLEIKKKLGVGVCLFL